MLQGRTEGGRQRNGIGFILSFDQRGFSPVKTSVPLLCTFVLSCEIVFSGLRSQDACSDSLLYQQVCFFAIAVSQGMLSSTPSPCHSPKYPQMNLPRCTSVLKPPLIRQVFPEHLSKQQLHPSLFLPHLNFSPQHFCYCSQTILCCTFAIYAIICPKTLYI